MRAEVRGHSKGVANDLAGPQDQILINQAVGNAFRNDVAHFLRSQGRRVITDAEDRAALTFNTPHGRRTLDLRVEDANGNLLGYVETKWGGAGARYAGSRQEQADDWLRQTYGFAINVVHGGG
jgi:hypothetical protein